jgi:methylmalonyl-CoA/ethylmalonyl-CoA epimerase
MFYNPNGCHIQLLTAEGDGTLVRQLDEHGDHVHHICFARDDLQAKVTALAEKGVSLVSDTLLSDTSGNGSIPPWQQWTFVLPDSTNGVFIELCNPYRAGPETLVPAGASPAGEAG